VLGEETQSLLVRLIERSVLALARNIQTYSYANAAFWQAEAGCDVTMIRPAVSLPIVRSTEPGSRGLVVGRVQRWKGPEVLCAALQLLGSSAPEFDWIGRDTAWDTRESSAALHLRRSAPTVWGDKIVHYEQQAPHLIAQRQATALFNVVPSTWDVFNFTAIEAMASRRPTIVSTGAGASELIINNENGYLFKSEDAGALAAVIDLLLRQSPDRLAATGRAARETVRTVLHPIAIAEQRIAAYEGAIAGFRSKPPVPATGWLGDMCRPTERPSISDIAFLEHLPMRAITAHLLTRSRRKVRARISRTVQSR
jgi:glycosyltransferase involved in cell wall biosynthesis